MLDEQVSLIKLLLQETQHVQRTMLEHMGRMQLSTDDIRDLLVPLQGLLDLLDRPQDQETTIGSQLVMALGQVASGMQRLERQQVMGNEQLLAQSDILSKLADLIETQTVMLRPIALALELEELPLAQG